MNEVVTSAMTTEQISLLKKLRAKVVLCLDNDNAGLLATANNGEELVKAGIETYVIRLSGEKDPDEYIVANGVEAFIDNLDSRINMITKALNDVNEGEFTNHQYGLEGRCIYKPHKD